MKRVCNAMFEGGLCTLCDGSGLVYPRRGVKAHYCGCCKGEGRHR